MSTTTAFHSKPPHTGEQGAGGRRRPWVVAATRAMLNETQKSLWLLWGRRIVVLLGISIPLRPAGLLPAALTLIDIAGFALLLGGLALSLPQIGAIAHLFSGLILLMNGAFFPWNGFPFGCKRWLASCPPRLAWRPCARW